MKYIVWIKEKQNPLDKYSERPWEQQGDGPLTEKQAARISGEIRRYCGCPTLTLPVDALPPIAIT